MLAVAAGHFDTDSLRKYPESVWRAAARTVPLGRLGRESEHAWLVALAATPLGRALSGYVITLEAPRQLVRPVAAAVAARRERHGPHRGAPPAGLTAAPATAIIGPSAAGEVLWLHRSLPSF